MMGSMKDSTCLVMQLFKSPQKSPFTNSMLVFNFWTPSESIGTEEAVLEDTVPSGPFVVFFPMIP